MKMKKNKKVAYGFNFDDCVGRSLDVERGSHSDCW